VHHQVVAVRVVGNERPRLGVFDHQLFHPGPDGEQFTQGFAGNAFFDGLLPSAGQGVLPCP
jgi:hypothetical protein